MLACGDLSFKKSPCCPSHVASLRQVGLQCSICLTKAQLMLVPKQCAKTSCCEEMQWHLVYTLSIRKDDKTALYVFGVEGHGLSDYI